VNQHRLEALVQRQRCQLVFAQAMYNEIRDENLQLREIVLELRERLLDAGLSSEVYLKNPEPDKTQLVLPLFADARQ
jgi:hypothetical protein